MSIRLLAPISGFLLVVSATVGADIPKPPEGKLTDPKLKYFKNLSNAKDRVDRLRNGNASVPLEDPDVPAVLVENREALKLVAQFYA